MLFKGGKSARTSRPVKGLIIALGATLLLSGCGHGRPLTDKEISDFRKQIEEQKRREDLDKMTRIPKIDEDDLRKHGGGRPAPRH
jgi:hypothetical protein